MTSTFSTPLARAQIEQLMQPALIRVIDNLRKQLDDSVWKGEYEENLIWPEGTTDAQKQTYTELQQQLHGVPTEEHDRVAALMSQLPQPSPLYTLKLTKAEAVEQTVDVWALCYQVCTTNYSADGSMDCSTDADRSLEADTDLLDSLGEVDWRKLDDKTKALIDGIFSALPG